MISGDVSVPLAISQNEQVVISGTPAVPIVKWSASYLCLMDRCAKLGPHCVQLRTRRSERRIRSLRSYPRSPSHGGHPSVEPRGPRDGPDRRWFGSRAGDGPAPYACQIDPPDETSDATRLARSAVSGSSYRFHNHLDFPRAGTWPLLATLKRLGVGKPVIPSRAP